MQTQKQIVGKLGEDVACVFLEKKGYKIVERNYLRKWGELDIVAKFKKNLHFIEVKTVSRESSTDVLHETANSYRPEENVHWKKQKRLGRAIQTYLADRSVSPETPWFFDVIIVYLGIKDKKARVKFLKDIILE